MLFVCGFVAGVCAVPLAKWTWGNREKILARLRGLPWPV